MNAEPKKLTKAREHLASFERCMFSEQAVHNLLEGFDLLTEVIEGETDVEHRRRAQNIGNTHVSMLLSNIAMRRSLDAVTEPELEQMSNVLLEVRAYDFGNKEALSKAIIKTATALFREYTRGNTKAEKWEFLRGTAGS